MTLSSFHLEFITDKIYQPGRGRLKSKFITFIFFYYWRMQVVFHVDELIWKRFNFTVKKPQFCVKIVEMFFFIISVIWVIFIFNLRFFGRWWFVRNLSYLMSGSCHFDRESNDEFSVEFWTFVIVMFFNRSWVLKFRAP